MWRKLWKPIEEKLQKSQKFARKISMAEFRYSQIIFLRFTGTLFHSNLDEKIASNEQKVTSNEQKVQPLLVTFCSLHYKKFWRIFFWVKVNKKVFMANCLTVSHTCYLYLPSRLSLFSSLVLLKKMRTRGESEISSFSFCVSYKSKELGGWWSPRFPCETPVVESSSDLIQAIIS